MKPTSEEQPMLNGEYSRATQKAMEVLVMHGKGFNRAPFPVGDMSKFLR